MTAPPLAPGFYWYRGDFPDGGGCWSWQIAEVYLTTDGRLLVDLQHCPHVYPVDRMIGRFIGPLVPPEGA